MSTPQYFLCDFCFFSLPGHKQTHAQKHTLIDRHSYLIFAFASLCAISYSFHFFPFTKCECKNKQISWICKMVQLTHSLTIGWLQRTRERQTNKWDICIHISLVAICISQNRSHRHLCVDFIDRIKRRVMCQLCHAWTHIVVGFEYGNLAEKRKKK